jgi:hypothetical protein
VLAAAAVADGARPRSLSVEVERRIVENRKRPVLAALREATSVKREPVADGQEQLQDDLYRLRTGKVRPDTFYQGASLPRDQMTGIRKWVRKAPLIPDARSLYSEREIPRFARDDSRSG